MLFSELEIAQSIQKGLAEMGFEAATDIQSASIPVVMTKGDMIGRSGTGTGKTAAFGIPMIQQAIENITVKSQTLVLCPTRELAMQISTELRRFSKYVEGVSIATIYGGQQMDLQFRQLRTAQIVVGTPGRVMDHLRRKTLKLNSLKTVVLDEADEMLNMGFLEDIETILATAPEERQTVLFSATMPPAIMSITKRFQKEPVLITADGGRKTISTIEQYFYNVPQNQKNDALKLLLLYYKPKRALIFCNTKKMVDELTAALNTGGFRALALHGDLRQSQRNIVMSDFKGVKANLLIATDVAARGIDVEDIEAVINYDIPQDFEYYIHRIGRTGRAGKSGISCTLCTNRAQLNRVVEIERYIKAKIEQKDVPSLAEIKLKRRAKQIEELKSHITQGAHEELKDELQMLLDEGLTLENIALALLKKFIGADKKLVAVNEVKPAEKVRKTVGGSNGNFAPRSPHSGKPPVKRTEEFFRRFEHGHSKPKDNKFKGKGANDRRKTTPN